MPPSDHAPIDPTPDATTAPSASVLAVPKMLPPPSSSSSPSTDHNHHRPLPLSASEASLPLRRATPSAAAALYAATLTPPGARSQSPAARGPAAAAAPPPAPQPPPGGGAGGGNRGPFSKSLLESPLADPQDPNDPLHILLHGLVPHVAVFASRDTDALARDKGFAGGLWELLRPFGERVAGKVHVRDSSSGASRAWDDFGVRFVRFGDRVEAPASVQGVVVPPLGRAVAVPAGTTPPRPAHASSADVLPLTEALVEKHLEFGEAAQAGGGGSTPGISPGVLPPTSPYYSLYLRRILSGLPVACHETFAHPVACVIAISSRNGAPIQTFQELYHAISDGEQRLPPWVDGEFLRYYVLVHDEDTGDMEKSVALFEQMKRKLGLHCHLLRMRSVQPGPGPATTTGDGDDGGGDDDDDDDDREWVPRSDWRTPAEEYGDLAAAEVHDLPDQAVFASDAAALRTFVREMVTQSVVPTMERHVATWNDQVASRRKGLSGRFVSLSRRWAGLGHVASSSSSSSSSASSASPGSSAPYDAARGFYRADAPEAVLRRLADYAFMLRDWKLAMATYDLVRGDVGNDKAWRYHAAANEMCAVAALLLPPAAASSSRTKLDTVQAALEQAVYSYATRCGSAYGAVRTALLAAELLRLRGGRAHTDAAARWGARLLEARLVGPVGEALVYERMAVVAGSRPGYGPAACPLGYGAHGRKAGFWHVLAAEAWVRQGKRVQAGRSLAAARAAYGGDGGRDGDMDGYDDSNGDSAPRTRTGIDGFAQARAFMEALALAASASATGKETSSEPPTLDADTTPDDNPPLIHEEVLSDKTDTRARRRSRHNSLLGGAGGVAGVLESAPLQGRPRGLSSASVAEVAEVAEGTGTEKDTGIGFGPV